MKHDIEWFLVLNARRARILPGLPESGESAPAEEILDTADKTLGEIMSDKPGRSFSSGSPGRRSAMEYGSDPVEEQHRLFLREVIGRLKSHQAADNFDWLTVFAAPDMLGLLRDEMPAELKTCVKREVSKNLVGIDETELPARIREELAKL
ncbi:host attachment protein [Alcanivoracaceae bacterium MT1]